MILICSMDEGFWDCSVCTYKNKSEAFKCFICDTRKGTSTRKPRVTATIVAQQIASSFPPLPPLLTNSKYQRAGKKRKSSSSKLKNIDHSSAEEIEVTVNGVTVLITDYKFLPQNDEEETADLVIEEKLAVEHDSTLESNAN